MQVQIVDYKDSLNLKRQKPQWIFVRIAIKIYCLAICGAVVILDSSLTPLNLNVSLAIMHTNSIREPADTELRDSI